MTFASPRPDLAAPGQGTALKHDDNPGHTVGVFFWARGCPPVANVAEIDEDPKSAGQ